MRGGGGDAGARGEEGRVKGRGEEEGRRDGRTEGHKDPLTPLVPELCPAGVRLAVGSRLGKPVTPPVGCEDTEDRNV